MKTKKKTGTEMGLSKDTMEEGWKKTRNKQTRKRSQVKKKYGLARPTQESRQLNETQSWSWYTQEHGSKTTVDMVPNFDGNRTRS